MRTKSIKEIRRINELIAYLKKQIGKKKKFIIVVTGTPGTGKTTISKKLKKKFNVKVISVKKLVKENTKEFDKKNKCFVISEKKIGKILDEKIKESKGTIIIDGHMAHYASQKNTDLVIVTKARIETITKRLKKRRYSMNKIKDNTESEIFDFCLNEAIERKHKNTIIFKTG